MSLSLALRPGSGRRRARASLLNNVIQPTNLGPQSGLWCASFHHPINYCLDWRKMSWLAQSCSICPDHLSNTALHKKWLTTSTSYRKPLNDIFLLLQQRLWCCSFTSSNGTINEPGIEKGNNYLIHPYRRTTFLPEVSSAAIREICAVPRSSKECALVAC